MLLRAVLFSLAVALGLAAPAHGQGVVLNLITAVDVSDSVSEADLALQAEGLARGIMDERFLADLGEGVGFEVFTWSSADDFRTVVPYTVLRSPSDAAAAALLLRAMPQTRDRGLQYPSVGAGNDRGHNLPGMTDIRGALYEALRRAIQRPAPRSAINLLADGDDNITGRPNEARDRAFAMGITINAVIFGDAADDADYFWSWVVTGPGAFVWSVDAPEEMIPTLSRKFWQDMVASAGGSR
jgi:hypothetical protein